MKILIDTNICLDILQKRPEFYENSKKALLYASEKNYKLYVTSATVMDIMYITRKFFEDSDEQKSVVKDFVNSPVKAVSPEEFLREY